MEKNYILKQNSFIENTDELILYLNDNFILQIKTFIYENFKTNIKFETPIIQIGQMDYTNKQVLNYFLITDNIPINNLKIFNYISNILNISVFLAIPIFCNNRKFKYINEIEFNIKFDFQINETTTKIKVKKVKKDLIYNISENFIYINKKS